jgi:hypothetical protein
VIRESLMTGPPLIGAMMLPVIGLPSIRLWVAALSVAALATVSGPLARVVAAVHARGFLHEAVSNVNDGTRPKEHDGSLTSSPTLTEEETWHDRG